MNEGESVGIIGESGSGKSIACKAMLQLLPQNARLTGKILYRGVDLNQSSDVEMQSIRSQEIAFISQDSMTALNPTMTIGNQILESYKKSHPLASSDDARIAIIQILSDLSLTPCESILTAYPHMLSGGMRQRVLIALALIRKPKILIADEPTTALNEKMQVDVLKLIQRLQKEKKMSLILISHDLERIAHFCDRVLVMYAGKIIESASTTQLFQNPQHPYTQCLIRSILNLNSDKNTPLNFIQGQPPHVVLPFKHCAFCERCPEAMNICIASAPPLYKVGTNHESACFKHHPRKNSASSIRSS